MSSVNPVSRFLDGIQNYFQTKNDNVMVSSLYEEPDPTPLIEAIARGEIAKVKLLAKNKKLLNAKIQQPFGFLDLKMTPLMAAAQLGRLDACKILLDAKADASLSGGSFDQSALHFAVFAGKADVVKFLLSRDGSLVDFQDKRRDTPLHLAAKKGNSEIYELLLRAGACPDVKNEGGYTPRNIHKITLERNAEKVKSLLSSNDKHSFKDKNGTTPLLIAAREGKCQFCKDLVSSGVDLLATDDQGQNLLHIAVRRGHVQLVREFADNQGLLTAIDARGQTPFQLAKSLGNNEILEVFKKLSAEVAFRTSSTLDDKPKNSLSTQTLDVGSLLTSSQNKLAALQRDLEELRKQKASGSNGDLSQLCDREKVLLDLVKREELQQAALVERSMIEDNDKVGDYYFIFQNMFSKVIAACMALDSEMLGKPKSTKATETNDMVLNVTTTFEEWGKSIPGVGLVLKIFNSPMVAANDVLKVRAIKQVSRLFTGATHYEPIGEMVARRLALVQFNEIQAVPAVQAGFFKRQKQNLRQLKGKIFEDDQFDTKLRMFAEEQCTTLLIAMMKGEVPDRLQPSHVPALAKIVLKRDATPSLATVRHVQAVVPTLPLAPTNPSVVDSQALMTLVQKQAKELDDLRSNVSNLQSRPELSPANVRLLDSLRKAELPTTSAGSSGNQDLLLASANASPGSSSGASLADLQRLTAEQNERIKRLEQALAILLPNNDRHSDKPRDDALFDKLVS